MSEPLLDGNRLASPAAYLAAELERLMALPLTTTAEVERWYDDCGAVQQTLKQHFPAFQPEHEFWHFCSDADIRSREAGYRDRQHARCGEQHADHAGGFHAAIEVRSR